MTVLCYHAVESQWQSALAVDPADFEAQCQWVSRHRAALSLDQALTRMGRDGRLPRGQVHLSFDDGFESLYDSMFPAVTRYGLPSSVFLVAQTLTPQGQVVDWVDDPPECPPSTLTLDQVLEMQDAGVDFQSHTWAHRDLTTLDPERVRRGSAIESAAAQRLAREADHQLGLPSRTPQWHGA